ncbi:hypothetical protein DAI22_09g203800 [Oryza sativa Japonica Group]|nr:hypothetical protein DAI22_09g203800 [Oryza sativa Japonica Group]
MWFRLKNGCFFGRPYSIHDEQLGGTWVIQIKIQGHYLRNARQAPVVAHEDGLLVRCFPSLHPPSLLGSNVRGLQGYSTEDGVAMDSDQHGRDGSDNGWCPCAPAHACAVAAVCLPKRVECSCCAR